MTAQPERLFVLDQNFPHQVLAIPWPAGMRLEALDSVDRRLTRRVEDWEIILHLAFDHGASGFVTNDVRILDAAREMVVLSGTNLQLVVCDGVGHDPLKATGLVMLHAADIAKQTGVVPMTYRLRPKSVGRETPGQRLDRISERLGTPPNQLISAELSELRRILGETDYARLRSRST